jgi:hypothetical protein
MRIVILLIFLSTLITACSGKPPSGSKSSSESGAKKASPSGPVSLDDMLKAGGMPSLDTGPGLMGPDTNSNGVRDDIEAWINSLPYSLEQKKALMQLTAAQQQSLLHSGDITKARVADDLANRAHACVFRHFEPGLAGSFTTRIESYVANTLERGMAYAQFLDLLNNRGIPDAAGEVCDA